MDSKKIIRRAGTAEEIAVKLGVSAWTVRSWATRDRIPARYWGFFVDERAATLEELSETVAK